MNLEQSYDYSSLCRNHKYKNKSKFTCIPIGLTQGQFNLNAFKITEQYKWFQMRSACLMAFCQLFIQDPLKWSSKTINTILINGAKVVKDNYVRVKENGPLDCVLNIESYIAKIRIEEPIFLNTNISTSHSLAETLQTFFQYHQQGLFRCLNSCYLIWQANGIYYLFDGQGNGSAADDMNGFASLVCTESLKDVSKLLKTISAMKLDDCYTISPIKMKHFREGVSNYTKPRIQYIGTNTYTIISDCFAILSGKFHVGHNGFQSFKNRQSMAVNLMALIHHVIQPANSWNSQLIDKIILLGTKLFHECKKTPQGEVTIQHLPHKYSVLEYIFKIDYKPYDHSGQMGYSLDEMKKNLLMHLQRAIIDGATNSIFIQTNSLIFAVWESNNYFYIFDAYARNQLGEVIDDNSGTPCIHMHGSLESLCNVLAVNLNAIATTNDGFVLHGVKVTLEVSNDGRKVNDVDLELINTFMDDQFWAEMNNFQESSARSEEVCNLDESSDDDIFLETVGGLTRAVSSVDSSESRSTTSFVSESEASVSVSRTESSSSEENESFAKPNDNSDLQISKSKKVRSKSPKTRKVKNEEEVLEEQKEKIEEDAIGAPEANEDVAEPKQDDKKRTKEKKSKQKPKDGTDGADDGQNTKKRKGKQEKNKSQEKIEADAVAAPEANEDVAEPKQDDKKRTKEKKSKQKPNGSDGADDGQNTKKRKGKKEKNKSQDTQIKDADEKQETKKSLVVVESSSGTETSITKLLVTSFKISDRVLLVTDWGDFFVAQNENCYFLLDGCLCDYNALIQINLNDLDSSKRLDDIDGIVSKVMDLKSNENVKIKLEPEDRKDLVQANEIGEEKSGFSGEVDTPMWELIEGMIELMKTTAKFDKIKSELI